MEPPIHADVEPARSPRPDKPGEGAERTAGLSTEEAERRLQEYGPNALRERTKSPILTFLGYFWGPIPWMIEIAAILSLVVRHIADFVIIAVLLVLNAVTAFAEEHQAGNAIAELRRKLALRARVRRDGQWEEIEAAALVPGDVVRLVLGDVVPADMKLEEGDYLSVDQSALTGESLPVDKRVSDDVMGSSVVKQGMMVGVVTATGARSYLGRTAKLVGSAHRVSHFQRAVLTIGDYLIYMTLGLVVVLILVGLVRHEPVVELLQFALVLTVAAIPVAMPAVLSVTMAVGALALSRMKAIVARLEAIEEMAGIDVLCSDKTGTLTENQLTLGEPIPFGGASRDDLVLAAALASPRDSRDAIDEAVLRGLKDPRALERYRVDRFIPFDPVHKRTEATILGPGRGSFTVTKGAPQVILSLCHPAPELAAGAQRRVSEQAEKGYRTLGVARRDEGGDYRFLGLLPLFDPPRADAASTIALATQHGITVKMVTGDNLAIARQIASELGLAGDIAPANALIGADEHRVSARVAGMIERASGFAQVYPEHKYAIVHALQERGHLVGMTGDGVNDAPALKQADVGIAVAGATDAARAAAALVLTAPGLSVIVGAVEEARRIFERMNSYAIYRITETIRISVFVVLAMIVYGFYPLTAVLVILLALLNDLPIMTIAYDRTWLDPRPVRWEMRRVLTLASVLGGVGVVETFGMLIIATRWLHLSHAEICSLIFLKLAIAGHLTLFVARTREPFYARPHPAPALLAAVLATKAVAVAVVGFGWFVAKISWADIGIVLAYCLAWLPIEDGVKLAVYKHLGLGAARHRRHLETIERPLSSSHQGAR